MDLHKHSTSGYVSVVGAGILALRRSCAAQTAGKKNKWGLLIWIMVEFSLEILVSVSTIQPGRSWAAKRIEGETCF